MLATLSAHVQLYKTTSTSTPIFRRPPLYSRTICHLAAPKICSSTNFSKYHESRMTKRACSRPGVCNLVCKSSCRVIPPRKHSCIFPRYVDTRRVSHIASLRQVVDTIYQKAILLSTTQSTRSISWLLCVCMWIRTVDCKFSSRTLTRRLSIYTIL
jgi:hypothetical protein